jgi:hypothetical protein
MGMLSYTYALCSGNSTDLPLYPVLECSLQFRPEEVDVLGIHMGDQMRRWM